MKKVFFTVCLLLSLTILFYSCMSIELQREEPIAELSPITNQKFNSWSLFLVTNPDWLRSNSADRVNELYDNYKAFGAAIGPDHLAVWFWKNESISDDVYGNEIDVGRASAIIARINEGLPTEKRLIPSKGPFVYVTTTYPGRAIQKEDPNGFPNGIEDGYILQLGCLSAQEISAALNNLTDQLVRDGVPKEIVASEQYWRAWQSSLKTVGKKIGAIIKGITLVFKTPFGEMIFSGDNA